MVVFLKNKWVMNSRINIIKGGIKMNENEDKLKESIRYLLENISVNSFKAQIDLDTRQVKVELLAEFEDLDDGKKENIVKIESIDSFKESTQLKSGPDSPKENTEGMTKELKPKSPSSEKSSENSIKNSMNDKLPSDITKKISRFLTSGIAPGEKH
jgi:hypothetical protein